MKSLIEILNESAKPMTISELGNGPVITIDLSKIGNDSLETLFQETTLNWGALTKADLKKLYKLLGVKDLSFEEWTETNEFVQ